MLHKLTKDSHQSLGQSNAPRTSQTSTLYDDDSLAIPFSIPDRFSFERVPLEVLAGVAELQATTTSTVTRYSAPFLTPLISVSDRSRAFATVSPLCEPVEGVVRCGTDALELALMRRRLARRIQQLDEWDDVTTNSGGGVDSVALPVSPKKDSQPLKGSINLGDESPLVDPSISSHLSSTTRTELSIQKESSQQETSISHHWSPKPFVVFEMDRQQHQQQLLSDMARSYPLEALLAAQRLRGASLGSIRTALERADALETLLGDRGRLYTATAVITVRRWREKTQQQHHTHPKEMKKHSSNEFLPLHQSHKLRAHVRELADHLASQIVLGVSFSPHRAQQIYYYIKEVTKRFIADKQENNGEEEGIVMINPFETLFKQLSPGSLMAHALTIAAYVSAVQPHPNLWLTTGPHSIALERLLESTAQPLQTLRYELRAIHNAPSIDSIMIAAREAKNVHLIASLWAHVLGQQQSSHSSRGLTTDTSILWCSPLASYLLILSPGMYNVARVQWWANHSRRTEDTEEHIGRAARYHHKNSRQRHRREEEIELPWRLPRESKEGGNHYLNEIIQQDPKPYWLVRLVRERCSSAQLSTFEGEPALQDIARILIALYRLQCPIKKGLGTFSMVNIPDTHRDNPPWIYQVLSALFAQPYARHAVERGGYPSSDRRGSKIGKDLKPSALWSHYETPQRDPDALAAMADLEAAASAKEQSDGTITHRGSKGWLKRRERALRGRHRKHQARISIRTKLLLGLHLLQILVLILFLLCSLWAVQITYMIHLAHVT